MTDAAVRHDPAAIELEHIWKSYPTATGSLAAVRDVSLSVARGEVFGIIGRSGAGKSTLLRIMNLLERPDSGRVTVGPHCLTEVSKGELRRVRQSIGFIFQQFNLLQNADVFDNVALPLVIHGWPRPVIRSRVREVLEFVGLSDKIDAYPRQLSGGQKQRVAIARALAGHAGVLLCDEPTSALDTDTTRSLLAVLRDINERLGVTIVIVTHQLAVIRSLCDRVAVIQDGAIAETFAVAERGGARITALARELADAEPEGALV